MTKIFLAGIPKLYPSATHFVYEGGGGDWSFFGWQGNVAIVITIKYIPCKF